MSNHPVTPPPELVRQWAQFQQGDDVESLWRRIATCAARWGADQELEACCADIVDGVGRLYMVKTEARQCLASELRAARRPKPPSLKRQAIDALHGIIDDPNTFSRHIETLRRALESLPENE